MTPRISMLLALSVWAGPPDAASPPPAAPDCDALYEGDGRPKDLAGALACYRAEENWAMVAIMQLNGEGTTVDVAGARATFKKLVGSDGFMDADASALNEILERREKNPKAPGRHIDFCKDVAAMTPSLGYCDRRDEDRTAAQNVAQLAKLRSGIEAAGRPAFDAAVTAFQAFVRAEGERVYQKWIDGTIRAQASIAGESFARANFMRRIQLLASAGGPAPGSAKRPFADADRQLNVVYQQDTGGSPRDYKRASRKTQHEWVRYRDAMGKLAAARWPSRSEVADLTRELVTEDRIAELTPPEGDMR